MTSSPGPLRLTTVQWLICAIAAIGFAFDIYVLLMLPLIIKQALAALGGIDPSGLPLLVPVSAEYVKWARTLFFVPALAGGVFGLLGGYLTDRLGRRRVLVRSEEHTSELQSLAYLVCRLLLEKKKQKRIQPSVSKKEQPNKHRKQ